MCCINHRIMRRRLFFKVCSLVFGFGLILPAFHADANQLGLNHFRPIPVCKKRLARDLKQNSRISRPPPAAALPYYQRAVSTDERNIQRMQLHSVVQGAPITKAQASELLDRAVRTLGVDFRLAWSSTSTRIEYKKGKPVTVNRGLVQLPGMTLDGLALILAHEAAHSMWKDESRADYWASRKGLRKLWGKAGYNKRRALHAGVSALKSQFSGIFDLNNLDHHTIEINGSGYPTLQSRWDIYKRGTLGHKRPRVGRRQKETSPEFLTTKNAAAYLGISERDLLGRVKKRTGPVAIQLKEGTRFLKEDLDKFL